DGRIVLVSNCGFWEMDNFTPLIAHIVALCKNVKRDFSGALLRPHGPALKIMLDRGFGGKKVVRAAKEAGRQLVEDGNISIDTLSAVKHNLLPKRAYKYFVNFVFAK
ncbi:MAG: flavodoxin family protein, partial [Parcubacteria group bacterium]|nr:flavodoxin family protein [Parcubacteria group bacterium]